MCRFRLVYIRRKPLHRVQFILRQPLGSFRLQQFQLSRIRNSYEELSKKEADEGELIRQKLRIWWSFSVEGDISWEMEGDEMVVTFALPIEAEGQNT